MNTGKAIFFGLALMLLNAVQPNLAKASGPLIDECRREKIIPFCEGLALGFFLGIENPNAGGQKICMPSGGVTGVQLATIYRNYLRAHPEKWTGTPVNALTNALQEAFKCK